MPRHDTHEPKTGAVLLAMRRAAQVHQYNHLVANLLIYHEVVTMSKASVTFIKSQGSERYNQTAPVSAVGRKTETSMRARCLLGINARRDA
jgi:hypothetical protein